MAMADHITGGEMYYTFLGKNNGQNQYAVTLKLYMRCSSGRPFNNPTIVSIFDKVTGTRFTDLFVNLSKQENISLPVNSNPCITNPPSVCYDVGYYNFNVALPASTHGYVLASQVNFRIGGIHNLMPGYGTIGATYSAEIPGSSDLDDASTNNSAHFIGNDLVMICKENSFNYSFAASDADHDQLQYSFCGAYISGSTGTVSPTPAPPFEEVPYGTGYAANAPLGPNVQIDESSGMISGIAPTTGVYVVTVCVKEIRNGKVIATQRKDLQIFIAPCSIAAAVLLPEYQLCRSSNTLSITNGSTSPLIHSYNWQFFDPNGNTIFTSTTPTTTYTFADTGIYRVKLSINQGEPCSDSSSSLVRVYPGLIPSFSVQGICFTKPTNFIDATTIGYGTITSLNWTFGEASSTLNTSQVKNPVFTYASQGSKEVQLIVSTSKGCRDTLVKILSILDKSPLQLTFKDTLTCKGDSLQLKAVGSGNFTWIPSTDILLPNTATPVVAPLKTTVYVVHVSDNGCTNSDSVRVRVVDRVRLEVMNDTVICKGDTVRLRVFSDALHYSWTSVPQVSNAGPDTLVVTFIKTLYHVTANTGSCLASGNILVSTIPYPFVFAGNDTTICYHAEASLHGVTNATEYKWLPSGSLKDATLLDSKAIPTITTFYILSATGNQGCPKPSMDTVVVQVQPKIRANGGRDTAVIVGQPLQLNASGGLSYQWFPGNFLSASNSSHPIATFSSETEKVRFQLVAFDQAGCSDTTSLTVTIYKTIPEVFVPTAFTPNKDGKNDLLRPVAAGISQVQLFQIFNRWGQLMYGTSSLSGPGWDGTFQGKLQPPGTFIWVVKATDYLGKSYFKKGLVTLIW